jgi:8-oxo-dGTP pyrophosphatase MutT (NUDIX family)
MWGRRRQAARVVVLDEEDRVLLLRARDPMDPTKGSWWEIPGGGIEGGEPSALAAARELYEETGIRSVEIGPCVWQHHARFVFAGMLFDQDEHIHVARLNPGGPRDPRAGYSPAGLEALEAMAFQGMRWWAVEEMQALVSEGGRIIPPWLTVQLPSYLASGPPAQPLHLGELENLF